MTVTSINPSRDYNRINKETIPFILITFMSFFSSLAPSINFLLSLMLIPTVMYFSVWSIVMFVIAFINIRNHKWILSLFHFAVSIGIWPYARFMLFGIGGSLLHLGMFYPLYVLDGAVWFSKTKHAEYDWGSAGGGIVANIKHVLVYDNVQPSLNQINLEGEKIYPESHLQKLHLIGNFYLFTFVP